MDSAQRPPDHDGIRDAGRVLSGVDVVPRHRQVRYGGQRLAARLRQAHRCRARRRAQASGRGAAGRDRPPRARGPRHRHRGARAFAPDERARAAAARAVPGSAAQSFPEPAEPAGCSECAGAPAARARQAARLCRHGAGDDADYAARARARHGARQRQGALALSRRGRAAARQLRALHRRHRRSSSLPRCANIAAG